MMQILSLGVLVLTASLLAAALAAVARNARKPVRAIARRREHT